MKFKKEKLTKENLYKFLKDNNNKNLIITLFLIAFLILFLLFVKNMWVQLILYYLSYYILKKYYDKVVDYLFRDIIVNSSK